MAELNGVLAPPPLTVSQWTPLWCDVQLARFFLLWRQLKLSDEAYAAFVRYGRFDAFSFSSWKL